MMSVSLTIPDNLKRMNQNLRAGTNTIMREVLEKLRDSVQHQILEKDVVASEDFFDSIETFGPVSLGQSISGHVFSTDKPEKVQAIEEGAPPHFPPVDDLVEWLTLRGIQPTEAQALRSFAFAVVQARVNRGLARLPLDVIIKWATDTGITPDPERALRSLAFAVGKGIAEHGTKARHIFGDTYMATEHDVVGAFDDLYLFLLTGTRMA
jgi:GNAT superfamily N-acetyltransferase